MKPITFVPVLFRLTFAAIAQKPIFEPQNNHRPNVASAIENANQIFNAIYSSMRQWGSSIQHNGMSIYPAYIPEGTLFYHGGPVADRPPSFEWLAFEIPHAEMFATRMKRRKPRNVDGNGYENAIENLVNIRTLSLEQRLNLGGPAFEVEPGYLHIYRTNRPMKVLYLDGMAAANSDRGTLDLQDRMLLNFTGGIWDEWGRADKLCDLASELGVQGFIRMECGFELIKCDFSDGLDFVSHKRRPDIFSPEGLNTMFLFEFVREIGSRYHGIDGGRVELDYSSMVSAFFYPTNFSNPDPDPRQSKLPRLVEADDNLLSQIRSDVRGAVLSSEGPGINWQGVSDMIVKRYAARLQLLSTGLSQHQFLSEINMIMNTFIEFDIPLEQQDPVEVCASHYLQPVDPSTEQDHLLEAAFKTVMHRICSTCWEIRALLLKKEKDENDLDSRDISIEVQKIQELKTWLDWSDWTSCGECAVDEVCFITVFPWGTEEEHYHPRCQKRDEVAGGGERRGPNYWQPRE